MGDIVIYDWLAGVPLAGHIEVLWEPIRWGAKFKAGLKGIILSFLNVSIVS